MNPRLRKIARKTGPLLMFFFFSLGARPILAQMVDLNGNGMSDIWELIYGASGLDPNADTDGDGVANRFREALLLRT